MISIQKKPNRILLIFLAVINPLLVLAADNVPVSKSFVKVLVPTIPTSAPTDANSTVTFQYSDGLGRTTMTVRKSINTGKDLVTINAYNAFGEIGSQWLPTPIDAPTTPTTPDVSVVMAKAKSVYDDDMPFTSINPDFDGNEDTQTLIASGKKWHDGNKAQTQTIISSESFGDIRNYVIVGSGIVLKPASGNLRTLVVKNTDADGKEVFQFIDSNGRLLMQRTVANSTNHDTYYVYNNMGLLSFVLSPQASALMTDETKTYYIAGVNTDGNLLSQYGYAYCYNAKGECTAKKLPGRDWMYMVYDRGGRLAFTNDGNQRPSTGIYTWTFYRYDQLGRLTQSGTTQYDAETPPNYDTIDAIATYVTGTGYTSTSALGNNTSILTQNFYDTYDFINLPYSTQAQKTNLTYEIPSTDTRYRNVVDGKDIALNGKLTGTYVAPLKSSGSIIAAMYYDYRGQVTQIKSNNHLGGIDNDFLTYNFVGQPVTNKHMHTGPNAAVTEIYTYGYDSGSRLKSISHSINGLPTIQMVSLEYDDFGRVNKKIIHGGMQTINYAYNLHNQLKSITSPKFSELISYEEDDASGTPAFNGNIASVSYGAGADYKYKYRYAYDGMNRLTAAKYYDLVNTTNNDNYNENYSEFDLNGNVKKLTRAGLVKDFKNMVGTTPAVVKHDMDQLTMTYAGNQVKSVTDANLSSEFAPLGANDFVDKQSASQPTEYLYDVNGNQTGDFNKGIAWIKYNILNLPEKIQFTNGNKIEYIYYADGSKKQAIYSTTASAVNIPLGDTNQENTNIMYTNKTDYCGRYVYESNVMKRILTPAGYLRMTALNAASIRYTYDLKDHLGNTHINLVSNNLANPTSTAIALVNTTEYYPSGMEIRPTVTNSSGINPYLYGGKELERMNGLNEYDFSARWYDYALPAFTTPDPLAELHYNESPYSYCGGNSINRVDPTGLNYFVGGGEITWRPGDYSPKYYDSTTKELLTNMGTEIYWEDSRNYYHGLNGKTDAIAKVQEIVEEPTDDKHNPVDDFFWFPAMDFQSTGIAEERNLGGDLINKTVDAIGDGVDALDIVAKAAENPASKAFGPIGNVINGSKVAVAMYKDNGIGRNTIKTASKVAIGIAGTIAGMKAGGTAGFNLGWQVGVWFEGVGAIPGAVIGGIGGVVIGGFIGSGLGNMLGESLGETITNN